MVQIKEEKAAKQTNQLPIKKMGLRSLTYILIMIVGGVLYSKLISGYESTVYNTIFITCMLIVMFLILGSIFVLFRYFILKIRDNRIPVKPNFQPIWFQILDTGFWIWLFFMLIIASDKILP